MKELYQAWIDLLKSFHINSPIVQMISVVFSLVVFLLSFYKIVKAGIRVILLRRNQRILNKYLHPFYSADDVERATKLYIPTRGQNVSPSDDEELGSEYTATMKELLIPKFLKEVFILKPSDRKYHLILADTGMGKTTFLINLYLAYKNKFSLIIEDRLAIALVPLGSPKAFEYIKK